MAPTSISTATTMLQSCNPPTCAAFAVAVAKIPQSEAEVQIRRVCSCLVAIVVPVAVRLLTPVLAVVVAGGPVLAERLAAAVSPPLAAAGSRHGWRSGPAARDQIPGVIPYQKQANCSSLLNHLTT